MASCIFGHYLDTHKDSYRVCRQKILRVLVGGMGKVPVKTESTSNDKTGIFAITTKYLEDFGLGI